jgi:hypothetical protein
MGGVKGTTMQSTVARIFILSPNAQRILFLTLLTFAALC